MTSSEIQALPEFDSPVGGMLDGRMRAAFHEAGVIILRNFVSQNACAQLRRRAMELVEEFDPDSVSSVFSSTDERQLDDRYFVESGDRIRFFLEDDAFTPSGKLRAGKARLHE